MAESSNLIQIPSPPDVIPKEEPVTLDKPESPNPFLPADQVEFNFDQITFTANNKVAVLYLEHPNLTTFKSSLASSQNVVLGKHSPEPQTNTKNIFLNSSITTFRNALRAHYLPHSSMYVPPPSITIVDYAKLIWENTIHKLNKKTREKVVLYPSQINLKDLPLQPTCWPSVTQMYMATKAPKTSSHSEKKVPQGKNHGAKGGLRRKQFSKHTSESQIEASKSKAGHLENENLSSSAKDKSLSHPQLPHLWLLKCIKRHIKQLLLLLIHYESASGNDISADSTAEADPGKFAPNDSIPHQ
ncbi:hypothetical protein Tco_1135983 [Tanacetum coccineum]